MKDPFGDNIYTYSGQFFITPKIISVNQGLRIHRQKNSFYTLQFFTPCVCIIKNVNERDNFQNLTICDMGSQIVFLYSKTQN